MSTVDRAWSQDLQKKTKSKRHRCFRNALRTALLLRVKGVPAFYCEGFLITKVRPTLHAWVEVDSETGTKVVELSPDYARYPSECHYFAARRFDPSVLSDMCDSRFQGCSWLWMTQEYTRAEQQALEFAGIGYTVKHTKLGG